MILHRSVFVSLAFSLVAACGGTTSRGGPGPDASIHEADGGSSDASHAADAACLATAPSAGDTCTEGQSVCSTGADACCIGYVWTCAASKWQKVGLGCPCAVDVHDAGSDVTHHDAGPVSCGGKTCGPNEYCTKGSGGAQLPDGGTNVSYTCTTIPTACVATPTCACIKQGGGGGGCICTDVDGSPSVECFYP